MATANQIAIARLSEDAYHNRVMEEETHRSNVKQERLTHEKNKIESRRQKADKKMKHEANKVASRKQKSDAKLQHEANKIASRKQKADKAMKHEANKIASRKQKSDVKFQQASIAKDLTKIQTDREIARAGRNLTRKENAKGRLLNYVVSSDKNATSKETAKIKSETDKDTAKLKSKTDLANAIINYNTQIAKENTKGKNKLKNTIIDNLMRAAGGYVGDNTKGLYNLGGNLLNKLTLS